MQKIKSLINNKWVKTIRPGSTGVGATFEYLLGIKENKNSEPDLKRIEIKTKRLNSITSTCLFSCAPEGEGENVIKRIVNLYGYNDTTYENKKKLNTFMYCYINKKTPGDYNFRLHVDYVNKRLNIRVSNKNGEKIDENIFWTFATLRQCLYRKCTRIAFIEADSRFLFGVEHFKYKNVKFYEIISFNRFLKLIEENVICVAINTTIIKSGHREGELHDHGTNFRIYPRDFEKLFERIYK